jgi:hypothetical protein
MIQKKIIKWDRKFVVVENSRNIPKENENLENV